MKILQKSMLFIGILSCSSQTFPAEGLLALTHQAFNSYSGFKQQLSSVLIKHKDEFAFVALAASTLAIVSLRALNQKTPILHENHNQIIDPIPTLIKQTKESSFLNPKNYQKNPCIRDYTLQDKDVCIPILKQNNLYGDTYYYMLCNPQDYHIIVYEHENKLVGICIYYINQHGDGYINILAIDQTYHKRGFGTSLLFKAMADLYENGCTKITLHSLPKAEAFYLKLGFKLSSKDYCYNEFSYEF